MLPPLSRPARGLGRRRRALLRGLLAREDDAAAVAQVAPPHDAGLGHHDEHRQGRPLGCSSICYFRITDFHERQTSALLSDLHFYYCRRPKANTHQRKNNLNMHSAHTSHLRVGGSPRNFVVSTRHGCVLSPRARRGEGTLTDRLRITALPSEQRAVGMALVSPGCSDCDHGGDPIANRLNSLNSLNSQELLEGV